MGSRIRAGKKRGAMVAYIVIGIFVLLSPLPATAGLLDNLVGKMKNAAEGVVDAAHRAVKGDPSPGTSSRDEEAKAPTNPPRDLVSPAVEVDVAAPTISPPRSISATEPSAGDSKTNVKPTAGAYPKLAKQPLQLTIEEAKLAQDCVERIATRSENLARLEEKIKTGIKKNTPSFFGVSMFSMRPEHLDRAVKTDYAATLVKLSEQCAGLDLGEMLVPVADELLRLDIQLTTSGRQVGMAMRGPELEVAAADIFTDAGHYTRAEAIYASVLNRQDLNAIPFLGVTPMANAAVQLSELYFAKNDPEKAVGVFKDFLDRHKTLLEQQPLVKSWVYRKAANVYLAAGRYDQGIELLEGIRREKSKLASDPRQNPKDFLFVMNVLKGSMQMGSEAAADLNKGNQGLNHTRRTQPHTSARLSVSDHVLLATAYANLHRAQDLKSLYFGDFKTYINSSGLSKTGNDEGFIAGREGTSAYKAIVRLEPIKDTVAFAHLFLQAGMIEESAEAFSDACDLSETVILQRWLHFSIGDSDRTTFTLYKQACLSYLGVTFGMTTPTAQQLQKAYARLLKLKGSLFDFENVLSTVVREQTNGHLQDSLVKGRELEKELGTLDRVAIFRSRDGAAVTRYIDLLNNKARADIDIRHQIVDQVQKIFMARRNEDLDGRLRAALPKGAIYIDFIKVPNFRAAQGVRGERYFAVTTSSDSSALNLHDLGDGATIESLVSRYQQTIRSALDQGRPPTEQQLNDVGRLLYDQLVKPIAGSTHGTSRWIVNPDGAIHLLPLEALVAPDGRYLIQEVEISYVGSTLELADRPIHESDPTSALLVAAPAYDVKESNNDPSSSQRARALIPGWRTNRPNFAQLDDTKEEATAIAKALARKKIRVETLLASDASKERIFKSPAGIVHVATHGFFVASDGESSPLMLRGADSVAESASPAMRADINPMYRAGLALAGANNDPDKGILLAAEIAALDFSKTDIAVLSACDTGVGDIESGDNVFGLKRAFLIAGAKSVLTSLWPVASDETTALMTRFYDGLSTTRDRSVALRESKLQLMKKKSNPFFWASFVLTGAPS